MKTLIVLTALPGAGKTTWSRKYKEEHENVFIVSSDEIRKEFFGRYDYLEHDDLVWKEYYKRLDDYSKAPGDLTVIADSTNISNDLRLVFINKVKGYDKKILVEIRRNLDVLLKQNIERPKEKFVPESSIIRMKNNWEDVNQEVINLFDEYLVVDDDFIDKN